MRIKMKQGTSPQYFLMSKYLLCMINIFGQAHCCAVPEQVLLAYCPTRREAFIQKPHLESSWQALEITL